MSLLRFFSRSIDAAEVAKAAAYALQVASSYRRVIETHGHQLAGMAVLEIGPGNDLGAQILMADWGARVTVASPWLPAWDRRYHPHLYRTLRDLVGPCPSLDRVISERSYRGIVECAQISAENLKQLGSACFDIVLSNAVLEHVADIDSAAHELVRVTRPGGFHSHQVDFRDHRNFDRPLEYLLDAAKWTRGQIRSFGHSRRPSEFEDAFRRAGVDPERLVITERPKAEYISDFLPRLRASASPYRDWDVEDLSVLGIHYVFKRPH